VKSNPVRVMLRALVLIFRAAELMNDIVSSFRNVFTLEHRMLFDLMFHHYCLRYITEDEIHNIDDNPFR
jgi:hypothetical protein